ncbi:head closure Hc1 [Vibrio phage K394]
MRAGKLRSKITLLHQVEEQDKIGGDISVWKPYATVRADDRVISSRDQLRGQAEISEEVHTIEIRYRSDIKPDHRVRLADGRELAIVGWPKPGDDQKKRSLIITARYEGK